MRTPQIEREMPVVRLNYDDAQPKTRQDALMKSENKG